MAPLCPEDRAILRAGVLVARPTPNVMDHRPFQSPLRRVRPQAWAAAVAAATVALGVIASSPAATPRRTLAFSRFLAPAGQPGRLSDPTGVATDTSGNVVVADTGHGR